MYILSDSLALRPSASPLSTMPVIDGEYYPNTIDTIFSHADRAALIALRAASSSFRDRSDACLFEHISIHYQEGAAHLRSVNGTRLPSPRLPSLPILLPFLGRAEAATASDTLTTGATVHELLIDRRAGHATQTLREGARYHNSNQAA